MRGLAEALGGGEAAEPAPGVEVPSFGLCYWRSCPIGCGASTAEFRANHLLYSYDEIKCLFVSSFRQRGCLIVSLLSVYDPIILQ